MNRVVIAGSGNAALCAGIAAHEALDRTDFGSYPRQQFADDLIEFNDGKSGVRGVVCNSRAGQITIEADAVVLGCGGFEASREMRRQYMGEKWADAKVRGTRHNTGAGIEMALAVGADMCGRSDGCHAVPMDLHMPDFGNLELPFVERKNYRKICYFLGIMPNANGERFLDEGENFRNYTYAQFGREILNQPQGFAWQIFDSRVEDLLYDEYRFSRASFVEVDAANAFDPTILDRRSTKGLSIDKTNWANTLDASPFKAYPVSCGITFTYAGLCIDKTAAVLNRDGEKIPGLYACGEMVGDIFSTGYPGGSGLTSGAVFGRIAGRTAAQR